MPRIALLVALALSLGVSACSSKPSGPTQVRIEIWDEVTGEALAGCGLQVTADDGVKVEIEQLASSWLDVELEPDQPFFVRVLGPPLDLPDYRPAVLHQEKYRGLRKGEARTLPLKVMPLRRSQWLRVVAAETGEPIPGAELVHVMEEYHFTDDDAYTVEREALGVLRQADENGRIHLAPGESATDHFNVIVRAGERETSSFTLSAMAPIRSDQPRLIALAPPEWEYELDVEQRARYIEDEIDGIGEPWPDPIPVHIADALLTWTSVSWDTPAPWFVPTVHPMPFLQTHLLDEESEFLLVGVDTHGQIIHFAEVEGEVLDQEAVTVKAGWLPTGFLGLYSDPPVSDLRVEVYQGERVVRSSWVDTCTTHYRPLSVPVGKGEVRFFRGHEEVGRMPFEVADQEYLPMRFELK